MAAGANDYFLKVTPNFATTIGVGGVADETTTTFPLTSVSSLATDTGIELVINRVNSAGEETNNYETVRGVISGNNLTSCERGVEGTAQGWAAGTVVEQLHTASTQNRMVTGILVEHGQDGTHDATKVAMLAGAQTVTGAKTFGAGLLKATSPQITTGINDSNGNEVIKVTATASAVNELTQANAATNNNPTTTASGGDDNVGWDIKMKGTGKFRKPTVVGIQVLDSGTATAVGDGKAFFRVPAELNGMNLTGVAATVYTAGTTNTTDIQIRNKTDSVDMLSTKLTIDSGETDTSTAATAAVIDATKDDVVTGDVLAIDVDAVSTTAAQGLYIELRFELP